MEEKKTVKAKRHYVTMEDRQRLNLTGVLDVLTFDEETIVMETEMGMLTIQGSDLHISKLNLEIGELFIDGVIESLDYSDKEQYGKKGGSFFNKLFK